jgi:hypothetical protein
MAWVTIGILPILMYAGEKLDGMANDETKRSKGILVAD